MKIATVPALVHLVKDESDTPDIEPSADLLSNQWLAEITVKKIGDQNPTRTKQKILHLL